MANLLMLLKLDLGITHDLRDFYFETLLTAAQKEIEKTGIALGESPSVEDTMLIVDYAAWMYRKRQEDIPLSRNLQLRIKNRVIAKAGAANAID